MRVFLTGGTGLIGSHVAERLRARGDEVVALVRTQSDTRFLADLACVLVEGDVRDTPEDLARGMMGAAAVVHAAALVYAGESWPRVRSVNVEGAAHVLAAAGIARVPAAVHLSSVAVYGPVSGSIDENTPTDAPLSHGDLYARSKREAEAAALREAADGRVALTLLRAAAVYGERDRLLTPRIASLVRLPVVPLVGDGRNPLPIVYAGNVAAAILACLDRPPPRSPRVFDVGLDHPLSQEGLLLGMGRALGHQPRLLHIPAALVQGAADLGERLGITVPGAGDLSLSRFARLALGDTPDPSRLIRRELGWQPPFGHEEGLARTAAWLTAERAAGRGGRWRGAGNAPPRGGYS